MQTILPLAKGTRDTTEYIKYIVEEHNDDTHIVKMVSSGSMCVAFVCFMSGVCGH